VEGRVRLTIPWDALASSNQRNQRRGGRAHGWGYKASLTAIHLVALDQSRGKRPTFPTGHVSAVLRFFPPDARRRDVANYIKGLFDALEGIAYANDHQLTEVTFTREPPDRERARVEIELEAIT